MARHSQRAFYQVQEPEPPLQGRRFACRDRANYQVTGSLRSKTLQRPWVSRQSVASKIAAAAGRAAALPETSVRVSVRASSALGLNPGDVVALDYPDLDLVGARFLVLEKTVSSPERPAVELELRQDRSHLNAAYHLPGEDAPSVEPEYGATPPAYSGIVELPMGLTKSEEMMFGFLPVRSGQLCNSYLVYQQRHTGPFLKVSQGFRFA